MPQTFRFLAKKTIGTYHYIVFVEIIYIICGKEEGEREGTSFKGFRSSTVSFIFLEVHYCFDCLDLV
ncbi:hypothetical protein ES332_D11G318200v1 [Gossypium tomentosum]|uniref:Uncharacterized protein n=1 Tax=Gossypium tomentosum TaxID=34277 RepID=A0A5D2IWF8_GOSTO|nr:hypothetical protein ES332_D11G318200v1 [Gossypium tomentosum]